MKSLPLKDKKTGLYNAIIETPKHSINKYAYNHDTGLFYLKKILPEGMSFPFDFGFFPQTLGGDGDPADVLIFMDEPGLMGSYVPVRLIGVIEAKQKDKKGSKVERNDRIIGIADCSLQFKDIKHIKDLNKEILPQIERFFENYNDIEGRKFKIKHIGGPNAAKNLVKDLHKKYKKEQK